MHAEGFGGSKRANPWGSQGAGAQGNPWGDIGAVATAWPELPEAIKAGIVAMVTASSEKR